MNSRKSKCKFYPVSIVALSLYLDKLYFIHCLFVSVID